MEDLLKRIETIIHVLNEARYTDTIRIETLKVKQIEYGQRDTMLQSSSGWQTFWCGSHWGGKDSHFCFKTYVTIPEPFHKKEIAVHLKTGATDIWDTDNPQFLAYIDNQLICAMDMNHHEMLLSEAAEAGRTYELGFYAYSNSEAPSIILDLSISVVHREVEKLYYDIKVPFEAAKLQREDSLQRIRTTQVLAETVNRIDLRKVGSEAFLRSVREANEYLFKHFYQALCGSSEITVHSIGHTHIDVAWKWPLRQTREKALRSFQTVLYLMNRYPEYKFMSSQPQLYEFVKEDCPQVYEQICSRIAQGRWETEGAMWLEADCNLISGESLIRQILYGKQFFQQEFGKGDNQVLWLPDVFGYSAALPQIMIKSGIKYFMTTKLAWNEDNQIPNDLMLWKGIDGSEILTYFITTKNYEAYPKQTSKADFSTTYNGLQNASQIMGTWQRFQNKDLLQEVLTCYGYGDGGGGATAQMLEQSRRLELGIPGCPSVKQTFVKDFFQIVEQKLEGKELPKWSGEFYLEFHRGTYTSMARNKRYNRKAEICNSDAELYCTINMLSEGVKYYPAEELKRIWKLTLLNQFHDILPGSSIQEVYEDSRQQYEEILSGDMELLSNAFQKIAMNLPTIKKNLLASADAEQPVLMLWNPLGFIRTTYVEIDLKESNCDLLDGDYEVWQDGMPVPSQKTPQGTMICYVKNLPSKGYRAFSLKRKDRHQSFDFDATGTGGIGFGAANDDNRKAFTYVGNKLETSFYRVIWNDNAEFVSIYDKEEDRELVQTGKIANQLIVFEDRPYEYDAWNIDSTYTQKSWIVSDLQSFQIAEAGPIRICFHICRRFLDSVIDQDIIFYHESRRIDFITRVDWKESQLLLKAAFPVDIMSDKAVYDIQYGNIERPTHCNTSWDKAKFEVTAHKWADLSEPGYGVALLNDCKYGYDIRESVMRLTLIKSGIFPNPTADQEVHSFTYSLLPHLGDFRVGNVVREAYDLNCPPYSSLFAGENFPAPEDTWSFAQADQENVVIDLVKKAEVDEDIIIRIYEAYGKRTRVTVSLPFLQFEDIQECDLMEQAVCDRDYEVLDNTFTFVIKPYEIKTYRIHKASLRL